VRSATHRRMPLRRRRVRTAPGVAAVAEQMTVHVQGHDNGRMTEQGLHQLGRQFTPAAFLRIDALLASISSMRHQHWGGH
jgi:hypothetical protein